MGSAEAIGGTQKFWFEGLPHAGVKKEDAGTQKFWFEGLPYADIFPIEALIQRSPTLTLLGVQ